MNHIEDSTNTLEQTQDKNDQDIFDKRFNILTNEFGKACESEGVELAIAVAIHPEEDIPIIYAKGHPYDIAVLLSKVLSKLKSDLLKDL